MEEDKKEQTEQKTEATPQNPVQIGLHPLGGIALTATDLQGNSVTARLTFEQAGIMTAHVTALSGMLIQSAYAAMMQEQMEAAQTASKIFTPGKR